MRLIDADALDRSFSVAGAANEDSYTDGVLLILGRVEDAPTVDAVAVVRCRECVHYEMGVCLKIYDDGAANKDAWQERNPNDFCSYGQRKGVDE